MSNALWLVFLSLWPETINNLTGTFQWTRKDRQPHIHASIDIAYTGLVRGSPLLTHCTSSLQTNSIALWSRCNSWTHQLYLRRRGAQREHGHAAASCGSGARAKGSSGRPNTRCPGTGRASGTCTAPPRESASTAFPLSSNRPLGKPLTP